MAVGRINEVTALTGFSYEKPYGRFFREKYISRNTVVAVLTGGP